MVISDFFMHFPYIYFFRHIHRNTQICTFKTNLLFSFMRKELHTQLSRLCMKLLFVRMNENSMICFNMCTLLGCCDEIFAEKYRYLRKKYIKKITDCRRNLIYKFKKLFYVF